MFKLWLTPSWLEKFLPDRLKPVSDQLFMDSSSQQLINQAEKLLDKLTQQATTNNVPKKVKTKEKQFHIAVMVHQQKIKITLLDKKHSEAAVKKRITIECYRKYFKVNSGTETCTEASIHYIKNGKTFVRSVKKSPHMEGVFRRIDQLDDALLRRLLNRSTIGKISENVETQVTPTKTNELQRLVLDNAQRQQQYASTLDPMIHNRLTRLLAQVELIVPHFRLLEIEEQHNVKRMLREDVPNLLETYTSLSVANQLNQKENVYVTLSKMELKVIELKESLEETNVQRLNHLLKLHELRYANSQQRKK